MKQLTLARQAEFQRYSKKTGREQFLEEMDAVMPWAELLALVEPHYSKGETERKPVGLDIMLRVYFLQQWFALSDPAAEGSLYESAVLRRFVGVDLGRAPAPDETTILNFRRLLEEHQLCGQMLDAVNLYLVSHGIRIATGTIVDATIVHAHSFNQEREEGTRFGDASDEERQSMIFRDEGAHRRGCEGGRGAFGQLVVGPVCTFRSTRPLRTAARIVARGLGCSDPETAMKPRRPPAPYWTNVTMLCAGMV